MNKQTTEYTAWRAAKMRTTNVNHIAYANYGGKGIVVCDGWYRSFKSFLNDMGDKPSPKHTLDRVDGDGNYSCGHCNECIKNKWPLNCRWATRDIQAWNKGKNKLNKSGYKGVIKVPHRELYKAQITNDYTTHVVGYSKDIEQAALAYDIAAIFFRGDLAITNILKL